MVDFPVPERPGNRPAPGEPRDELQCPLCGFRPDTEEPPEECPVCGYNIYEHGLVSQDDSGDTDRIYDEQGGST